MLQKSPRRNRAKPDRSPEGPIFSPTLYSMNYSSKVDEYNKQVHGLEKKDYSELVDKLVAIK